MSTTAIVELGKSVFGFPPRKASDIKGRIESIRQQVKEAASDYDKEKLQ